MTGFVDPLAAMVGTQLWQITLVAAAALALHRIFCRRRPHLAYMLLMVVVLKCLTPPVLSSPTGVFSWLGRPSESAGAENQQRDGDATPTIEDAASGETPGLATTRTATTPPLDSRPPQRLNAATILLTVWLCGALVLAVLFAWRWVRYGLALRESSEPADAELMERSRRLAVQLGLKRRVRLLVSSQSNGPLCFGVFRVCIVLPDELLRQRKTNLEPILAHELAHIRRWDGLLAVIQVLAGILWWFHPLIWWVNREISRQRERCCDEEALAGTGCQPETYAQSLLDVLKFKRTRRPGFVAFGIRPVDVTQARLETIMKPRRGNYYARTPWFCWLGLAAGLLLVIPGKRMVGDRAFGEEPRPPAATKKDARFNPREAEASIRKLIEQFVAAARDGNLPAAEKLLGGRPQPRAKHYVDDTKKVLAMGAKPARLAKVVAGPDRALAVTEFFVPGKGTDRQGQYCVLYQCIRQGERWRIRDIDVERVAGLVDEIGRFVKQLQESKNGDSRR